MRNFMSINKGLPKDDDKALYLAVKLSNENELSQFEQYGGMANARFFGGFFLGQAYDVNGHACLGIRLESVTHWKYATV